MNACKAVLILALAACFASACASGENANPPAAPANPPAPAAPPPASPASATEPPAAGSKAEEDGKERDKKRQEKEEKAEESKPVANIDAAKLYNQQKCVTCHLANGKGAFDGVPDFTDKAWMKGKTTTDFVNVIKSGKSPMPGYGQKLSEEEIRALAAYVRSFAR